MSMVVNANEIGRSNKSGPVQRKINLDLSTMNILCRYILQDSRFIRMEHLVNLNRLLHIIDISTYENDPERVKRMDFLFKALEARLTYNLNDNELILNHVNGGLTFKIDFIDYDNLIMDKSSIQYCHKLVEDTLKYSFFYTEVDNLQDLITQFKTTDISKRATLMEKTENTLDRIKNEFRKSHVEENLNDVFFSLDDGTFETAITDTYNMVTNPSRRLITGMQGMNDMLGGGFESGRVYMFLGVAGVGKSLTLLNIINQIKRWNVNTTAKDPSKVPCIVLLTMENTVVETITRLFDMVVDDSKGMGNYELGDVIYKMRNEGGLMVNESSPLNIVIRYKPNRSISTDYLYSLYDDLLDQGKEMVCLVQDHIKRIRSVDYNSDLRLELGDIVNEFKVFAAEKDIPVITISHLNREATKILEEASRKGNQDNGRLLGKSNTGESLLMIDNLDCAMTITRDYDKDSNCYMTFNRIKMRDKGSNREYIAQPFLPDNPIRLVEDYGSIPQFKESLHQIVPNMAGSIKVSGAASMIQNKIIDVADDGDFDDNLFNDKKSTSFNLGPVSQLDEQFKIDSETFDDDISNLIIEEYNNQKMIDNVAQTNILMSQLPSENPPRKVISFARKVVSFS